MGARGCCSNPSSKIIAVGACLQITIIALYVNQKLANTMGVRDSVKKLQEGIYREVMSVQNVAKSRQEEMLANFTNLHTDRVNKLREYCADYKYDLVKGYPTYDRLKDVLPSWNWISSPYHKLFYCATPKCASTTWKTYLMKDLKMNWTTDTHLAATNLGVDTMFPKEMPAFKDFLESFRPPNRFIIVRNPWARLVSAYEDKIVDSHWTLKKLCVAYEQYKDVEAITFDVFIDCLTHSARDVVWNPHVNPLTSLCGVCQMDYNLIVKLEEMSEAQPFIFQMLNFTSQPDYEPLRKGKYNKTYTGHYETVSKENIQLLHDIYKSDIEVFDYPDTPFGH